MKPIAVLICILIFSQPLFSQAIPEIKIGDTYKRVISRINNDIRRKYFNIKKSDKKIFVSSSLNERSIVEYYFNNHILFRIKLIQNVPNPDAMLAFMYRNHTSTKGEPEIVTKDGQTAYLWNINGNNQYFFKSWSDWFGRICFITIIEE